ncbi:TolC family protein [Chitinophaga oryzae]|uniref:TolC family protein n=1 Tax=Chitinophaga oryzae TaxID=2725414 RepID=A0AAE6ZGU6_9BACT|nr:TolC family protein [Chitinophaga oryzae]QJB32421.1 TolC family protein [Chitinophaga oryzae]QJB38893.1 TolC family protein [Chitinophaga oryzae]
MNSRSIYKRLYALASGIVLTLVFQAASAQQSVKPLSLNEAISLSLQNSKQLKASQARIEEANANVKTANERQLPDVSISGSYLRLTQPNLDLKLGKGDSNPGGGTPSEAPKVNQAAYGMANVSIPVFAGMMIQSGKEAARYLAQAARLDADKDRDDVIQNTIGAYSNLYKATQAVKLMEENLKQSTQRVKDFSNLEKNGLLARNDLLKAELQKSNYELSLMDAQNSLKVATLNMDIMLGLPDNTQLQLDTTVFLADKADNRGVAEFEQLAYQNRKDAASLGAKEKAAFANVKGVKGEYYPSLALTGGYVAAYIPNVVTVTNAITAGVGLKYSLSSLWKTGSKVASAKAQLAELQANEAQLTDAIHLDVVQSYENYLLSRKKMDTYIKAIEQSEENYRITKNKHDNNLATTTDLLDADVANLQSHLNYTFARADALVAYNKLLQASGILDNNK